MKKDLVSVSEIYKQITYINQTTPLNGIGI